MGERDHVFAGCHQRSPDVVFFVSQVQIRDDEFEPGWYWWMIVGGYLEKHGPFPEAEGAYLAAMGE